MDSDSDSDGGGDADWLKLRAKRKARRMAVAVAVHRRRVVAALDQLRTDGRGPQGRKQREVPFSWEDHLMRLTEADFKLRYRLDIDSFYVLLNALRPSLEAGDAVMASRAKWGHPVTAEQKLAVTLRFLAGGMVLDLKLIYKLSKSGVYDSIWRTIDAINTCPHLPVDFPIDDVEKLKRLEAEFRSQSRGGIWEGQVSRTPIHCLTTPSPPPHPSSVTVMLGGCH